MPDGETGGGSGLTGSRAWILVEELAGDHRPKSMEEIKEMPTGEVYPKTQKTWKEGLVTYASEGSITVDTGDESFTADPKFVRSSKPVHDGRKTDPLRQTQMKKLSEKHPDLWRGG